MIAIVEVVCALVILRLLALAYSAYNGKRLEMRGAVHYGRYNSVILLLAHGLYLALALVEVVYWDTTIDEVSLCGMGLVGLSYALLMYAMWRLGSLWTLNLYMMPSRRGLHSSMYRAIRPQGYVLSLVLELVGVAMICHAWLTLGIMFPLYTIVLYQRMQLEESVALDLC